MRSWCKPGRVVREGFLAEGGSKEKKVFFFWGRSQHCWPSLRRPLTPFACSSSFAGEGETTWGWSASLGTRGCSEELIIRCFSCWYARWADLCRDLRHLQCWGRINTGPNRFPWKRGRATSRRGWSRSAAAQAPAIRGQIDPISLPQQTILIYWRAIVTMATPFQLHNAIAFRTGTITSCLYRRASSSYEYEVI